MLHLLTQQIRLSVIASLLHLVHRMRLLTQAGQHSLPLSGIWTTGVASQLAGVLCSAWREILSRQREALPVQRLVGS
jgi:hypothetical protein